MLNFVSLQLQNVPQPPYDTSMENSWILIRVEKVKISNSFQDYKLNYKRPKLVNGIV